MANATQFLATVNSTVRTLLALVVVGGLGVGGWFGYRTYNAGELEAERREQELQEKNQTLARQQELISGQSQQIRQLNQDVSEKSREIDRLNAAMRLLKVDHRLAQITVLDQREDPETGQTVSTVEFRELNEEGGTVGEPRVFRLQGDTVYVDCWVVKFEDKYVEEADLLRSTSLCLFKNIYGYYDGPAKGHRLDDEGSRPLAYARGSKMTDFEKKIWDDFWNIANDPEKAAELGIRAAHGQANFTRVQKGKRYKFLLRASDGITTLPAEDAPQASGDPAT